MALKGALCQQFPKVTMSATRIPRSNASEDAMKRTDTRDGGVAGSTFEASEEIVEASTGAVGLSALTNS